MLLTFIRPGLSLTPYIRNYYHFFASAGVEQPICAELGNLRFVLEGGGVVHTAHSRPEEFSAGDIFFVGPTMKAYRIVAKPGTRIFGIGILPRAWNALFDADASDATDRIINPRDVSGAHAHEYMERVFEAQSDQERAALSNSYFSELVERQSRRQGYPHIIEQWIVGSGDFAVDDLFAQSNLSQRQVERLALRYFGASPKKLERKYRALRAADRLSAGAENWRDAAGLTYYDQAHFIKDFKTFVGVTPRQFVHQKASLVSTIRELQRAHENPLAVDLL